MKQNMKHRVKTLVLCIALLLTLPNFLLLTANAADLVVTASDSNYYVVGGSSYQVVDPYITLSGSGTVTGAKVYFDTGFVAGADYLTGTTVNNVHVDSYNSSTGVLTVTGDDTIANYQSFLRQVTYRTTATSGTKTIYFSVSQGDTSTYYYSDTGHFYEYVSYASCTWTQARTNAKTRSITVDTTAGTKTYQGYLANIKDANENAFIADKCAYDGWIGGSDFTTADKWVWMDGPEAGIQFWQGNGSTSVGSAVTGMYAHWNSGEPNNSGNAEYYAQMYGASGDHSSVKGYWNDESATKTQDGYLCEYGDSGQINLTSSSIDSCVITILQKPSSVSLSASPASISSMDLSWSATGASSYTVYRDGSSIYTGTGTSMTDTGREVNTGYTYYVTATNAAGSTSSSTVTKYTLAAVPSISVNNETTYSANDWAISVNGNPSWTTYLVEYSTDGTNWSTVNLGTETSGTQTGLAEDTTYYYRVCAYNGNSVATAYSSTVSVKTNDCPELSGLGPTNIYRSAVTGHTEITLTGTVTDHDDNTVKVSATMNGVEKDTTVSSTSSGAAWSLTWDVVTDSFSEGSYTSVVITANDGTGKSNKESTATWTYTLYVDKTSPLAPAITNSTAWTNAAGVAVTITDGADSEGSTNTGPDYSEYRTQTENVITHAKTDWTAWTTYSGEFTVTAAGITTVEARTYDQAGNVSETAQSLVKIDRTDPVGGSFILQAYYGENDTDENYTRSRTVNLTGITASESGGAETLPTLMQISNSASFTDYTQTDYATSYGDWTLTDGDGTKTVYVRFVDAVGNVGDPISDTIILDTTKPVISISAPSRYAAKNGLSVSYTVAVDDGTATLYGINVGDQSNITLTASGTVEDLKDDMPTWIAVTQVNDTTRRVTITLPADLTQEGTIAISVKAAAAVDPAGNESELVPGNFSFNVDCTAPTDQDILFPSDLKVAGGEAVTLAAVSADCDGGQSGDSVRFASVDAYGTGYDGTDPADGETITSTHGLSNTIIAPTEEGTYRLYVIDEAGNVSEASQATLTVKNLGPSVSVAGPSDSYVQAADSVEYTVTFGSDASEITLSQEDVILVRTGTANAYVDVADTEDPLVKTVTLSNLMGEGTVAIKIAAGSAADDVGNPSAVSDVSSPVTVDNTPATLTAVSVYSSNGNDAYAKAGDRLWLTFTSNEALSSASVTVCGRSAAAASDVTGTVWTASYVIPTATTLEDGEVTFSIEATDLAGNLSDPVTETTDGSAVTMDFTKPEVELTGETDGTCYTSGVTVEFEEGTAVLENLDSGTSASILSPREITSGGSYRLTVTDAAGNKTIETFVVSGDYLDVKSDLAALEITYASGDSADHVTRNVTLPDTGASGSDVTWETDQADYVTAGGAVTRPAYEDGNQTVTLTATVTKGDVSMEKEFILRVIAEVEDTDPARALDDAGSAVIVYAEGDGRTHVTQDLGLSDSGTFNGSDLTWASASDSVVISDEAEGGYYTALVTRPAYEDGDESVTLTVTAVLNDAVTTQDITITLKKQEGTDDQRAQTDAEAAYVVYQDGDGIDSVTGDITLVFTGAEGSTGVWSSDNEDAVTVSGDTGLVTRPADTQGDAAVELTLTVTAGEATVTRTFDLTVKALESSPVQDMSDVASDVDALKIGYRGTDNEDSVTTHLILPTYGACGSAVTWESSAPEVIAENGTVARSAAGDVTVTLKATVTKGTVSQEKTFTVTVKQRELSLLLRLGADADSVIWSNLSSNSMSAVTSDLLLMTQGANGSAVVWTSSAPDVIADDGTVTRQDEDQTVVLTAEISQEGFMIFKEFTVTVRAK